MSCYVPFLSCFERAFDCMNFPPICFTLFGPARRSNCGLFEIHCTISDLPCPLFLCVSVALSMCVYVCASISAENFEFVGPQRAHACEVVCSDIHAQMGYMHTVKPYRMRKWIVWYVIHSPFFPGLVSWLIIYLSNACMGNKRVRERKKEETLSGNE